VLATFGNGNEDFGAIDGPEEEERKETQDQKPTQGPKFADIVPLNIVFLAGLLIFLLVLSSCEIVPRCNFNAQEVANSEK
jgi:hypothetical protein